MQVKLLTFVPLILVNMSHNHSHNHSHGHIPAKLKSLNSVYYIAIILNLAYVAVEFFVGRTHDSMGLVSDAGHKLFDSLSLVIALVGFKLADSQRTDRYTYGYRKTSVLIALANSIVLLALIWHIYMESIEKLSNPQLTDGLTISWTAAIGIIVSGVSALLLMRHQKNDINTKAAFLHMATDSLLSIGVVVSGIIIHFTHWYVLDPIISLIIASVILANTLKLLKESFNMSIDAVPSDVNYNEVLAMIAEVEAVDHVEDMHIWAVSIYQRALSARLVIDDISRSEEVVARVKEKIHEAGIEIVTLETKTLKNA